MKPLVSIICPIRNEEDYIGACLSSLVNQTFDSSQIEILVVDGMSDDRTREIVQQFQQKYQSVRLLDNPKQIVPAALNIGIRNAAGQFIIRMDGHAKAAEDYVEKCLAALKKNGAEGVGGPIISVNEDSTGKAISLAMSSPFGVGNSRFRTTTDKECFVDTLAFPGYRRDVFEKYGLFDEELVRCQDDEFNFRIRKHGGKILLSPEIKSWYFPRSGFKKLWSQYFGYGCYKIRVLQKHFLMMQPRHFIPALFVLSLCGLLILSLFISSALWGFAGVMGLYVIAAASAAFLTWRRDTATNPFKILLSFYILHFSYGSGFVWGLIRFAPRWFINREPKAELELIESPS